MSSGKLFFEDRAKKSNFAPRLKHLDVGDTFLDIGDTLVCPFCQCSCIELSAPNVQVECLLMSSFPKVLFCNTKAKKIK